MSNFLSTKQRRGKLLSIDKFFHMLTVLDIAPKKKFHLMCLMETNTLCLNNYIVIAERHGFIRQDDKVFFITEKGREINRMWQE